MIKAASLLLISILCGCTLFNNVTPNGNAGKAYYQEAELLLQERNFEEALVLYELAAEQEYVPAYRRLATINFLGLLGSRNHSEAVRWLKKGVDKGDVGSSGRLAYHYLSGRGVEANKRKGMELLEAAAKRGDAYAQQMLVGCQGGYNYNNPKPNKLTVSAARQGNADAQYDLGVYYRSHSKYEDMFKWFFEASMEDHDRAQQELAECYLYGLGTKIDEVQAIAWVCIRKDWGVDQLPEILLPR